MSTIELIHAGQIVDSSGDPTVEVAVPKRRGPAAWPQVVPFGRFAGTRELGDRPYRPSGLQGVPPGALPALEAACGPLSLDRLFVLPCATRFAGRKRCEVTPTEVLGFGNDTVALWIDDGAAGRVVSIPQDRLIAIDDRQILLYGRLTLVSAERQIVVRYNTVARDEMRDNLVALRCRAATAPVPTEPGFLWLDRRGEERAASELPYKWAFQLGSRNVRSDPDEPAIVAVGDVAVSQRRGGSRPASGVAVLTPREFVIAAEPSEYLDAGRYGVDLLAVPRGYLHTLGWDGRSLTVSVRRGSTGVEGATITLPLDVHLVQAMRQSFGSAARWV